MLQGCYNSAREPQSRRKTPPTWNPSWKPSSVSCPWTYLDSHSEIENWGFTTHQSPRGLPLLWGKHFGI